MPLLSIALALVAGISFDASVARAVQPDEVLSDTALEKRARALSAHLRCLVCQNQSIDDSDAPLARDLRVLVRERLKAGESDAAVFDYVVARYGDFVLLKPPFKISTLLLWASPLLLLLAGIGLARSATRVKRGVAGDTAPLSRAEQKRFDDLMKRDA
ncbi:MAG: cytochrome c-type biogenesis protein CcmH [Hyphomicrobium sp.]|nr:cytochrome c-type biogenesis protein CcmH [Hyphomicrobium sp.]